MPNNITVKDANGSNITMETIETGGVHSSVTTPKGYDSVYEKMVVGTARDKFRDNFRSYDTVNNWETVQTGAGMTITTDGVLNGSRYLNVAMGTTINSETILLSRNSFKFPLKFSFSISMSQRIANNEVFVELVSVDGTGAVETDTTIAASANTNNALNCVSYKFDGTTATNAIYLTRGYGISELVSSSVSFSNSTAASGTTPNFIPGGIWEICADMEEVVWQTKTLDSNTALAIVNRRTQNIPDPTKEYKIRIRFKNLGTAPASSTNARIHAIRVLDTTRMTVDMNRQWGRNADVQNSIPTAVTAVPTIATVTTVSTANVVASPVSYRDSTTALAAAATFNGTGRDIGTTLGYNTFCANATASHDGTLFIDRSADNTNWSECARVAVTATAPGLLQVPIMARYYRVRYLNGATLQTSFTLDSCTQRL